MTRLFEGDSAQCHSDAVPFAGTPDRPRRLLDMLQSSDAADAPFITICHQKAEETYSFAHVLCQWRSYFPQIGRLKIPHFAARWGAAPP